MMLRTAPAHRCRSRATRPPHQRHDRRVPAPDWEEYYLSEPRPPFEPGDLVRATGTGQLYSVLYVEWAQWDESPDDHPVTDPPVNPHGSWEIQIDGPNGAGASGPLQDLVKVDDAESVAEAERLGLRRPGRP
jgi:hypothetical protein